MSRDEAPAPGSNPRWSSERIANSAHGKGNCLFLLILDRSPRCRMGLTVAISPRSLLVTPELIWSASWLSFPLTNCLHSGVDFLPRQTSAGVGQGLNPD
jgi:hypothetical protein